MTCFCFFISLLLQPFFLVQSDAFLISFPLLEHLLCALFYLFLSPFTPTILISFMQVCALFFATHDISSYLWRLFFFFQENKVWTYYALSFVVSLVISWVLQFGTQHLSPCHVSCLSFWGCFFNLPRCVNRLCKDKCVSLIQGLQQLCWAFRTAFAK